MRTAVRVVALVLVGLCVVAAVCAFLPGWRKYHDRNGCADDAMGRLVSFEHDGDPPCEPDWIATGTKPSADAAILLLLLPSIAIGVLVVRRPKVAWSVLWSSATIGLSIAAFVATFHLDLFSAERTVELWPARILEWSMVGFYAVHLLQLVAGLITMVVVALLDRRRRKASAVDPMPRATVVDR